MQRAYYANPIVTFLQHSGERILGVLAERNQFDLGLEQRNAWQAEIKILKNALARFDDGYLLIEYSIPRMGKRVDAVLLMRGLVIVVEFKVGDEEYKMSSLDQVMDYALDLKNFHEASHQLPIVPMLVATEAPAVSNHYAAYPDLVYKPLKANQWNFAEVLTATVDAIHGHAFDASAWMESVYKPTPTIIEAAQALYRGHNVTDISRSEAGGINLKDTTDAILDIIHQSKVHRQKAICFVTGVPGAGKTLVGLNIANARLKSQDDEYAVFLSGNGPLVAVLREALARDDVARAKAQPNNPTKKDALRHAQAFIQNIHHFRDEALETDQPLTGKVVIFDEAQRAWNQKQTADFMAQKRKQLHFQMSEPEFLISVMDRNSDWAVIVCLVGGGQEINKGEAGLLEWFAALDKKFSQWQIYVSKQLTDEEYTQGHDLTGLLKRERTHDVSALHLGVSNRSFRAEEVSALVKALLDLEIEMARTLYHKVQRNYPIALTRDLNSARAWIKTHARGTERYGLVASSGGIRLRPAGIDVKSGIEVENWFLNDKEDVRSSFALEQVATEFDIQGLELDWTVVAWDANFRLRNGEWHYRNFSGTRWQIVKAGKRKMYLKNAYRVLLTRARQGMVIFVPAGNHDDKTRQPDFYDDTFAYLKGIGFGVI